MKTPASIHGHPIHPMLVTVPIGLWLFSFVCDLVFMLGQGKPTWSTVATYCMAGGLVGALLAAVPGAIDLISLRHERAARTGLIHMALNLTVVGLFAVNLYLRLTSEHPSTGLVALSAFSLVLLVISGWLGGRMVYELGVGVTPEASPRSDPNRSVRMASRGT